MTTTETKKRVRRTPDEIVRAVLDKTAEKGATAGAVVFRLFGIPKKTGSHETRRWREMDSNSRSPVSCDPLSDR